MPKPSAETKKKLIFVFIALEAALLLMIVRIFYIQGIEGQALQAKAYIQQTRDRSITPMRGGIYDRNMVGIGLTETVSSISVIRNQIKNPEEVARVLSETLGMDYNTVLSKVSKKVALERIKTKVDKSVADTIRAYNLPGVMIDEDVKRVYPYATLASQVVGFVGKDNQGIIGLEAKYDGYLKGQNGKILTETDVLGRELPNGRQIRVEPTPGLNLVTTVDVMLQQYAEQTIEKAVLQKNAKRGVIILMNPQNGEIYAMANKPDFDLNQPFQIQDPFMSQMWDTMSDKERSDALNQMWRNFSINDTYEPGSTFKIITSAAGLQENIVDINTPFSCNGSSTVAGRQIKCWRYPRAHGSETFLQGVENSCNPVFMSVAEKLGAQTFYDYLIKFGFNEKTGIDLPGEAKGILYKPEKIGPVELATMSFGQSLTITPLQLLRASAATVNGGYLITPHLGKALADSDGKIVETLSFPDARMLAEEELANPDAPSKRVVSKETSETMKFILQSVVYAGTGNKTYIPGYRVGGKTATSEKLPRRSGKYIASFLAFAPADDPQVMAIVLLDEPQGTYYGGAVAGPIMKEILENALPYLNVTRAYTDDEIKLPGTALVPVPSVTGLSVGEAKKVLEASGLEATVIGEGDVVMKQFPLSGEEVNQKSKILLYT